MLIGPPNDDLSSNSLASVEHSCSLQRSGAKFKFRLIQLRGATNDKYTIDATPQYSKLNSKTGLFMRIQLFKNDEFVAAPEIFSSLGQQASIQIQHDPKFVGFERLELSAFAETIK